MKPLAPVAQMASLVGTPAPPKSNETRTWEFLRGKGYTPEQTAGIMGNLMQEHKFSTSDATDLLGVKSLGIAQWTGNRRDNLLARGDYLNLDVQLNFLEEELNGTERRAGEAIRSSMTLEEATLNFQDKFERCHVRWCRSEQRIGYGREMLSKFKEY